MVSRPHEVSAISMASWLPAATSLQATPLTPPCGRPGESPSCETMEASEKTSGNYMGVSKNRGTPKSSILIGFSIINHPFLGTPIFGNTHILKTYLQTVRCLLCHSLSLSLAETVFDGSPQLQRQTNLGENREAGEILATNWHVIWHLNIFEPWTIASSNALSVVWNENIWKVPCPQSKLANKKPNPIPFFSKIQPFRSISTTNSEEIPTSSVLDQPLRSAESLIGFMICRTLGLQHFT